MRKTGPIRPTADDPNKTEDTPFREHHACSNRVSTCYDEPCLERTSGRVVPNQPAPHRLWWAAY